jgi:hypothetical protein
VSEDASPLSDLWSDAIEYARQSKAHGGNWTCTLHMHDAENIIVGQGITQEAAERDALEKAGRLKARRFPTWPLTAIALFVAGFAGIQASLAMDWLQIVASVVALVTATRLLVRRL